PFGEVLEHLGAADRFIAIVGTAAVDEHDRGERASGVWCGDGAGELPIAFSDGHGALGERIWLAVCGALPRDCTGLDNERGDLAIAIDPEMEVETLVGELNGKYERGVRADPVNLWILDLLHLAVGL